MSATIRCFGTYPIACGVIKIYWRSENVRAKLISISIPLVRTTWSYCLVARAPVVIDTDVGTCMHVASNHAKASYHKDIKLIQDIEWHFHVHPHGNQQCYGSV
jgi:hypothetical protein